MHPDSRQQRSPREEGDQSHPAQRSTLARVPLLRSLVSENIVISPEYESLLHGCGLDDFQSVWSLSGGQAVTFHRDRSVTKVLVRHGSQKCTLYVKRLGRARFKQIMGSLLLLERPLSRCRREWKYARLLEGCGIDAPPMAALGEVTLGTIPLESSLVVAEIPGAVDLDAYLGRLAPSGERREAVRALTDALAHKLSRMHSAGIVHQDLYAKHVFVKREGAKLDTIFIDLQRMRRSRRDSIVARDLAALNVTLDARLASERERLWFIATYARRRWGRDRRRTRRLLRKVLKRCAHIEARSKFRDIEWRREGCK